MTLNISKATRLALDNLLLIGIRVKYQATKDHYWVQAILIDARGYSIGRVTIHNGRYDHTKIYKYASSFSDKYNGERHLFTIDHMITLFLEDADNGLYIPPY